MGQRKILAVHDFCVLSCMHDGLLLKRTTLIWAHKNNNDMPWDAAFSEPVALRFSKFASQVYFIV